MILNGWRLTPIDTDQARKLPEGTALIVERVKREARSYQITERHYYRAVTRNRKTVAGPDVAICSEPDADWPELPPWQLGWIWLQGSPGYMGFYTYERDGGAEP